MRRSVVRFECQIAVGDPTQTAFEQINRWISGHQDHGSSE
jgi:hypothetical protein